MRKFLLSLMVVCGLAAAAEEYAPLYLFVWDNDANKGFNFELTSTDGVVYNGTGFDAEGGTNLAGIQVVNTEWTVVYGCPAGEWYELKTDGTPVQLVLGGPNGCWMWDATIAPADHVWFNADKAELVVNQSADSPWGSNSLQSAVVDNAGAVYYNLLGMPVANPSAGRIYIKKQGDKVSKVVL